MLENKNKTDTKIDSTNIFEDFTSDVKLGKEVEKQEQKAAKDIFYYVKNITEFLKVINLIVVLGICVFFLYSFVQNKNQLENYSFLSPVCSFFLGDVSTEVGGCYGVTAYGNRVESELLATKRAQFDQISPLFTHIYELDNFASSKKVTFLLEKTDTRLRPLDILSDFDALKNRFEPIDKSKVQCFDIVIKEDSSLSARCEAYSSDWDSDITTFDNQSNSGTSISVASSFIDFLESTEGSNFKSISKQRVFDSVNVSGNGIYTKKTDFDINLRYTDTNNLAL